jgi:L-ascorbate metabolism protein UlaG (beta-lactamase superfamily)
MIPEANRSFVAERLGIDPARPIGLDDGLTAATAGFEVTGVPAAHETLDRDERGRHRYLGYVIGCGPWSIYHSGDTVLYDGMVARLARSGIDVALLPINGRRPERRVPGNLDGREAARLARDIGARLAIPCHFEMFEFNTAAPDDFAAEAERIGQEYRILQAGERLTLRAPTPDPGNPA